MKAASDDARAFKHDIHDRIARCAKEALGRPVDYWFAIEVTGPGRVHLHGGIGATDQELPALAGALMKAGGHWEGRGSEHQVELTRQWCLDGWARYAVRDASLTRRNLGIDTVLSVTRGCRKRAEKFWEALRKKDDYHDCR